MIINNMNQEIEDILDPDNSWHEKIEKFLATYQSLYSLPKIENREKISPSFFNYCLKGRYFVVIVLYNSERSFFGYRRFDRVDSSDFRPEKHSGRNLCVVPDGSAGVSRSCQGQAGIASAPSA